MAKYNIGEWTQGIPRIVDYNYGCTLTIGRYCTISPGVTFLLGGEHGTNWITTYPFYVLWNVPHALPKVVKGPIVVGNDVWFGINATILSGVTIGDGAVVGAESLVVKDVPPYAIVEGVPAKVVGYKVPQHLIEKLVRIAWWNWPQDQIMEATPLLLSENVETFVNTYYKE